MAEYLLGGPLDGQPAPAEELGLGGVLRVRQPRPRLNSLAPPPQRAYMPADDTMLYMRHSYRTTWPMGAYGWRRREYTNHDTTTTVVWEHALWALQGDTTAIGRAAAAGQALQLVDEAWRAGLPRALRYVLPPTASALQVRDLLAVQVRGSEEAALLMETRRRVLGQCWVRAAALARCFLPASMAPACPVPWQRYFHG